VTASANKLPTLKFLILLTRTMYLRKNFGAKRKGAVGKIRNFMTSAFLILAVTEYYWSDPIRRVGWAGHVACMWEKENTCEVLMGKPEEN
jgi:hypothetical protein